MRNRNHKNVVKRFSAEQFSNFDGVLSKSELVIRFKRYRKDAAQFHYPILPVHLLLLEHFPSEDYLRNYHGPVGVLVADQDHVVPEKFVRLLNDNYQGPKRLWEFSLGDHGTVMFQLPKVWK